MGVWGCWGVGSRARAQQVKKRRAFHKGLQTLPNTHKQRIHSPQAPPHLLHVAGEALQERRRGDAAAKPHGARHAGPAAAAGDDVEQRRFAAWV